MKQLPFFLLYWALGSIIFYTANAWIGLERWSIEYLGLMSLSFIVAMILLTLTKDHLIPQLPVRYVEILWNEEEITIRTHHHFVWPIGFVHVEAYVLRKGSESDAYLAVAQMHEDLMKADIEAVITKVPCGAEAKPVD